MSSFKQQNINKFRMVHTLNMDLGICKAETPHYNSHPNRSRASERCPDHRGEFRDLVFKFVNLFLCLRGESWSKSSLFADLEQANTQEGAGVGPFFRNRFEKWNLKAKQCKVHLYKQFSPPGISLCRDKSSLNKNIQMEASRESISFVWVWIEMGTYPYPHNPMVT